MQRPRGLPILFFIASSVSYFLNRGFAFLVTEQAPSSCRRRGSFRSKRRWPSSKVCSLVVALTTAPLPSVYNSSTSAATEFPKRKRQVRRKALNPHPRYYWSDISNVRGEFHAFWRDLLGDDEYSMEGPPTIPNEALLNHVERNDLRYAIVLYGGRRALSERLGGAPVMAGKWTKAAKDSRELQLLIQKGKSGLCSDRPPPSPGQKKQQKTSISRPKQRRKAVSSVSQTKQTDNRWKHRPGRKPRGYWSLQQTVQELFDYLDECPTTHDRPSVWMPRLAEFGACSRQDLQLAIRRYGGATIIGRMAGLVPFSEWQYFEGQLQLLGELKEYLDKHCYGDLNVFPSAISIQRNGYESLYSLIQQYGGRKCVANRFGMKYSSSGKQTNEYADMNWGPFSIDFAVELLQFVRDEQMKRKAPLRKPVIAMPSEKMLSNNGPIGLHDQIQQFGGYENVARRLGLAFFDL